MVHFYSLAALTLCAICAVSVVSAGIIRDGSNDISLEEVRQITVVKDINEFKKNHPGLALVALKKENSKARSGSTVEYKLGGRVQGDSLVAQIADAFVYEEPKDVTVQLTYPQSGTGSIVTYVEISCEADSSAGNAYVIAGGIGQRFISIVLESTQTETFFYSAQFFGSS
ncbi:uncharacterized protein LOC105208808 [Zeugodacus cucurbitae]|uniref:Anti-H(O) lectin 2 n=1 Tax=Zeugodacus cucurbitae TaxID=28588 RepID=A0A0A1XAW3_ZEUCU|nr:uncharacterized protein LOC105208808 [Zeugodacus cucurbitae]